MSSDLSMLDYNLLSCLTTSSLVKSTWHFLFTYGLTLTHDINIPPLHLYDQPIMQLIPMVKPSQLELACINRCWLYLRAYYVSDIADGSGTKISDDAWDGKRSVNNRAHSWPSQGQPTRSDWETCRKFLRLAILSRGRRLRTPLGQRVRVDHSQTWFLDPQSDQLHQKIGDTWFFHPRLPRRSGRPLYSATGTPCNPPAHYHIAQVYPRGNAITCNGHSSILPSPVPIRKTFREYLFSSTEVWAHWCFENLILPQDDGYFLATAIRDHAASAETLKAVSDGSFKNCCGTAAWVLSCPLSPQQISGKVVSADDLKDAKRTAPWVDITQENRPIAFVSQNSLTRNVSTPLPN